MGPESHQALRRFPPASGIRTIFDRTKRMEAEGIEVLHLEVGKPAWKMPKGMELRVQDAIADGFVHYVQNRGLLELRESVSDQIERQTGRRFDPDTEIIITIGASEAVCMTALTLLDHRDEIIVPMPAWPHYDAVAQMAGARVVPLPLRSENGFQIDTQQLEDAITPATRLVVVNSPSNPTGGVQTADTLREVAALSDKHGFYVLCDDVYRDFVYEGTHESIASYMGDSNRLIYINSFSKSYAMTGWRLGYVAADAELSDALNRIHQYTAVCGVSFAQKAAAQLLSDDGLTQYLQEMKTAFMKRRKLWSDLVEECDALEATTPEGAFYTFPRVEFRSMTGREFCSFVLDEHAMAMVPGDVFGPSYEQHVRISYGGDLQTQARAVERMGNILNG